MNDRNLEIHDHDVGCRFFFFKQKTAYEITYGDWSSDVCSSDLLQVSSLDGRTGTYTVTTKFEAATPPGDLIRVGDDARAIVSADFNSDGITDLATANRFDQSVSILLGRGDGTFQVQTDAFGQAASIRLDSPASALATGDFN